MDVSRTHTDWKDWFSCHGPRLLLFARQQTRNEADAEDVLQEALIRTWRTYGTLAKAPLAMVFKTIRWCAIDLARREDRRSSREQAVAGESSPLFEPPSLPSEPDRQLENALRGLPAEQRAVVSLKIWGELTFEEIGATLDISPNTAASRYRYALERMKELLSQPTP